MEQPPLFEIEDLYMYLHGRVEIDDMQSIARHIETLSNLTPEEQERLCRDIEVSKALERQEGLSSEFDHVPANQPAERQRRGAELARAEKDLDRHITLAMGKVKLMSKGLPEVGARPEMAHLRHGSYQGSGDGARQQHRPAGPASAPAKARGR